MSPITKDFILLIPCYNNLDGLVKSVKSIHHPPGKFEILIVDDGSTSAITVDSLSSAFAIKIIRIPENKGVVNALNTGLKALNARIDYNYIARLDAGDTCHPERFTKQVQFLDTHSDIFLLGSWCRFENDQTGKGYDYIAKTKHQEIIKEMHYKCSFIHPTVMFRKEVLNDIGFYPENYPDVEDYAYFWQILTQLKGEILSQILVKIDFSDKNLSSRNYKKQLIQRMRLVNHFGDRKLSKIFSFILLGGRFILPKKMITKLKLIR
ncbi:MAG: glycosyltransferase [Bacteroidetes bacterium]|nr:glycosyltransferase [Bacteroidota bacterium]